MLKTVRYEPQVLKGRSHNFCYINSKSPHVVKSNAQALELKWGRSVSCQLKQLQAG